MDDFEKDKLKAKLHKQCYEEVKLAKLINNQEERELIMETILNKYEVMFSKIGVSSWKSLIEIKNISEDEDN